MKPGVYAPGVTSPPAEPGSLPALRAEIAGDLHARIAALNTRNIAVQQAREHVERYRDPAAWQAPFSQAAYEEVAAHLAPLPPNTAGEEREPTEAKRFDLTALGLQLALLQSDAAGFAKLQSAVIEIAENLLTKLSVPQVKAQAALLQELVGDEWWQDVTLPLLDSMRKRVRGLTNLVDKSHRAAVYTDFLDELGEVELVELSGQSDRGVDRDRFKRRTEAWMAEHEDYLAVQKIRRNKPLTVSDISVLEEILQQQGLGTAADVAEAKATHGGELGLFLRRIIGLDRAEAKAAFDEFYGAHTLTANQNQYLTLLIDTLSHHGYVEIDALFEPPFSQAAPSPDDLFTGEETAQIIDVIKRIKRNAAPYTVGPDQQAV